MKKLSSLLLAILALTGTAYSGEKARFRIAAAPLTPVSTNLIYSSEGQNERYRIHCDGPDAIDLVLMPPPANSGTPTATETLKEDTSTPTASPTKTETPAKTEVTAKAASKPAAAKSDAKTDSAPKEVRRIVLRRGETIDLHLGQNELVIKLPDGGHCTGWYERLSK